MALRTADRNSDLPAPSLQGIRFVGRHTTTSLGLFRQVEERLLVRIELLADGSGVVGELLPDLVETLAGLLGFAAADRVPVADAQLTIDSLPGDLQQQFGFLPVPGRGLSLGALGTWWRLVAGPLAPDVVRHVPRFVMPAPGRGYSEIAEIVEQQAA